MENAHSVTIITLGIISQVNVSPAAGSTVACVKPALLTNALAVLSATLCFKDGV